MENQRIGSAQPEHRVHTGRRLLLALAAVFTCLLLTVPLFGSLPAYNRIIHVISPELAEVLMPPSQQTGGTEPPLVIPDPVMIRDFQAVSDSLHTYISFTLADADYDRLDAGCFQYLIAFGESVVTETICTEQYNDLLKELRVALICPFFILPESASVTKFLVQYIETGDFLRVASVSGVNASIYALTTDQYEVWNADRLINRITLSPYTLGFSTGLPAGELLSYQIIITYSNGIVSRLGATLLDGISFDLWQTLSYSSMPGYETDPPTDRLIFDEKVEPTFCTYTLWQNATVTEVIFFNTPLDLAAVSSIELVFMEEELIPVL